MKLEITKVFLFGEECWQYMQLDCKLHTTLNDEEHIIEFTVQVAPLEKLILNIDFSDDYTLNNYDSSYVWSEVVAPTNRIKIIKYLTSTKIMKLLKILRETILVKEGYWDCLTVSDRNKHYNYFYKGLSQCFNNGEFGVTYDVYYTVKEGCTFYLEQQDDPEILG